MPSGPDGEGSGNASCYRNTTAVGKCHHGCNKSEYPVENCLRCFLSGRFKNHFDMAGAEKLLGKGDMLYYPVGLQKPIRVKGSFVSDHEVEQVVEHVKSQGFSTI